MWRIAVCTLYVPSAWNTQPAVVILDGECMRLVSMLPTIERPQTVSADSFTRPDSRTNANSVSTAVHGVTDDMCDIFPAMNTVTCVTYPSTTNQPTNYMVRRLSWKTVPSLHRIFTALYGSLQKPATCPYPEPNPVRTLPSYFLQEPFKHYTAIEAQVLQAVSLRRVSPPKLCTHVSSAP